MNRPGLLPYRPNTEGWSWSRLLPNPRSLLTSREMDHPIRVHWPHLSLPCLDPENLRTASLTFSYWSSLRYVESGFLHSRATIPNAIRFSPSIAPRAFLSEKFLPWLTRSEPSAGLPCDYIPPVSRVGGCNALRAFLYIPDKRILESKSLNLYPWSCHEEGEFHEHVTKPAPRRCSARAPLLRGDGSLQRSRRHLHHRRGDLREAALRLDLASSSYRVGSLAGPT